MDNVDKVIIIREDDRKTDVDVESIILRKAGKSGSLIDILRNSRRSCGEFAPQPLFCP